MAKKNDHDAPKGKLNKKGLRDLLSFYRYFRPYRGLFVLALILLMASSMITLLFPKMIQELLDKALVAAALGDKDPVYEIAMYLGIAVVAMAPVSFLRVYLFYLIGEKSMAALRKDLYKQVISLPMSFFAKRRVGEISSRIGSDISLVQETFITTLAELIRGVITLIVGIAFIITISPELSLVMLATLPVVIIAAMFFGRYIRKLSKERQDRLADSSTVVEETLQGVQSVKSYANEQYEGGRYDKSINALVKVAMKSMFFRAGFSSFIVFALFGTIVGIIAYGADMVASKALTIGELTGFIMYTFFIAGSMGGFGTEFTKLQRAIGATERMRQLFQEEQEPNAEGGETHELGGAVTFDGVTFAYPGSESVQVLADVSFQVQPGEVIALVGPSGAGKSTVISLIEQFYMPTEGRISFDGQDASGLDVRHLRAQMALVPQDVFLFGGTIRENIAYGKLDATQEEIEAAAAQANAHDFISEFPDGYDSIVGERGLKLSGGQRQRIAIARAVLRDPKILILDEATSALDSESERLVQAALEKLMQNRTSFVIAHRLSTIKDADRILVLEKGKLVEEGTHDSLSAIPGGLYASLARLQFSTGQKA